MVPVSADSAPDSPQKPWHWRDIQWRQLWARQDYANFCLTAGLIVATVLVTALAHPHTVPFVIWDARIAMPLHSELDTIPNWVAVFAPVMMLLLTVVVGEFLASRRQHRSVTDAVSTAIYFFLDGIQSFVMAIFLTQVFKVIVGRLRPNFLARCQPLVPADTVFTIANMTEAIMPSEQFPCSETDNGVVEEGRVAFPSGHTSVCFSLAMYACGYLIWVWHWRRPCSPRRLSFGQEFRRDLLNVLAKTWMLAMLCFAWGVGISRVIDYQHDVSDVLGGAFLGTMIALVYLMRAIPRWRRVLAEDGISDGGSDSMNGAGGSRMMASSGDLEIPIVSGRGPASDGTAAAVAAKQRAAPVGPEQV